MKPKSFTLHIEQSKLEDLWDRLIRTRWPDMTSDPAWSYGTHFPFMKRLVSYWSTEFDWRAQEAKRNKFSQLRVLLGGVDRGYGRAAVTRWLFGHEPRLISGGALAQGKADVPPLLGQG